ncbi:unnamed protein product [Cuscuta campestris]|uniref:Reverse transcriptase domain-containing protein n=1 Tax=Cuscuta campestris TaxID=132261 RepID=A0A484MIV9_9ASTE|nr:unnamed protein product [Cuscuta campestris]
MRGLMNKVFNLRKELHTWNRTVFGNIFSKTKELESSVLEAKLLYDENPSTENRSHLHHQKALLIQATNNEFTYWKQKASIKWIREGDCNTSFFHSIVKERRISQKIHKIKSGDGQWIQDKDDLLKEANFYFQQLYSKKDSENTEDYLSHIPNLLTVDDNSLLTQLPNEKEVKDAIWNLDPLSAAGPDGFTGEFYKNCWDIIKEDVVKAVQEFFLGIPTPKSLNECSIIMIPKKDNPITFEDFRPICLSNFIAKVNTKVISQRLRDLLPKLISEEQGGFVKGRQIHDQILIAQEIIQNLDYKTRGGNIAIKLDMSKAFDRVSWDYLQAILGKLGFDHKFINLILNNLKDTTLSININGYPSKPFQPKRGLKQGDPLSPLLFILAAEGFSRGLHYRVNTLKIEPFNMGRHSQIISHLAFADDLLIFLKGTAQNLARFSNFLKAYEDASGQTINLHKSSFYPPKKTQVAQINRMGNYLGMKRGSLPFKYLGTQIHKGINRLKYCTDLLNHFDHKLKGWYKKFLSQGGRMILIKHVLSSIPLHLLGSSKLPKSVINCLHTKMSNFLWGNKEGKNITGRSGLPFASQKRKEVWVSLTLKPYRKHMVLRCCGAILSITPSGPGLCTTDTQQVWRQLANLLILLIGRDSFQQKPLSIPMRITPSGTPTLVLSSFDKSTTTSSLSLNNSPGLGKTFLLCVFFAGTMKTMRTTHSRIADSVKISGHTLNLVSRSRQLQHMEFALTCRSGGGAIVLTSKVKQNARIHTPSSQGQSSFALLSHPLHVLLEVDPILPRQFCTSTHVRTHRVQGSNEGVGTRVYAYAVLNRVRFMTGIGEGQSTSRLPLFDGTNYSYWKERMRIYIRSTNFQLWLVIKNGEQIPMKKVGETTVPKTEDEFDAEDIKKVENNAKAINMLYCAVNPDDYHKISCCTTAKEMWDKLEKTYANKDLVRKIPRSLTPEWRSKADAIYESIGVSNVTIDGLRGNLKTYKFSILTPYLDEQKQKGIALKATKELVEEVSSDDDNEFGLVIKKFHKFMKKEFKRKGKKYDGPPKCYGCGEIGHIKPRCPRGKNGKDKPGFKKQRAYISWGGDSGESTDQE